MQVLSLLHGWGCPRSPFRFFTDVTE
jgi:hypothetical protein